MRLLVLTLAVVAAVAALSPPNVQSPAETSAALELRVRELYRGMVSRYGAAVRQLNHRTLQALSAEQSADRKLLAECSDLLDDDGNLISFLDTIPEACTTTCDYFETVGMSLPELTCPESPMNATDLPVGSCCNDDSDCEDTLVCDKINNVCTNACDSNSDCEDGSWSSQASCENTALSSSDSDNSDKADDCSFCNYGFECSGAASFCSICTDYVGPVDMDLVTEAGCMNTGNDDDSSSFDADALDVLCTQECAIDCVAAMADNQETAFTCIDYYCGITGQDGDDLAELLALGCSKYHGEYCTVLFMDPDILSDCDGIGGCCWYTLYGAFSSFFCPDAPADICPNDLTNPSDDDETSAASTLSATAAATAAAAVVGAGLCF